MLLTIQRPSFPSYEVALSSDDRQGDTFASASNDGVLRIFDLRRSSALHLYHRITFIQWNKHLYLHIESVIETLNKPAATHNSSTCIVLGHVFTDEFDTVGYGRRRRWCTSDRHPR